MKTWMSLAVLLMTAGWAAAHPKPAPVPPSLEIEILDPNVDPQGNPAVIAVPKPGCPTQMVIDIPPTVLVHRYYYTGDRSFQMRMLPGGPTVLVANHPRTGERLYIPAQMFPGAPRVTYTNHKIEYDFGQQVITVQFCHLSGRADVSYSHGQPVGRGVVAVTHASLQRTKTLFERTGIPDATRKSLQFSRQATVSAVDGMRVFGKAVTTPVKQAIQFIPGVNALTPSSTVDQADSLRNLRIDRAVNRQTQLEGALKTNR